MSSDSLALSNFPRVAFIGLGIMGEPMAKRLLEAGYPLAVFDTDHRAMTRFEGTAARLADSAINAVRDADFVILMLPDSHAVESCCFGEHGMAAQLRKGVFVINMSTADLAHSLSQAARLSAQGCRFVDAPVGRTPEHAWRGELLALVGAEDEDFERVLPLLSVMASDVEHLGPPGSGLKLKIVNNYLGMIGMAMTAEALVLADRLSLPRDTVLRCLATTSAGRGQLLSTFPRKVLKGDVTAEFPLAMGRKDLLLGLALAEETGTPRELGLASRRYFEAAPAYGRDEQDCTAMLLLLHDMAKPV